MKAIRIHAFGGAEQLKCEEVTLPPLKENEVLIKIKAASVNHLEVLIASGKKRSSMPVDLPWTPGFDGAGVVEEVANDSGKWKKGDEVYFRANGGTYAESIILKEDELAHKPKDEPFIIAAAVPHTGLTAWQALFTHGELKAEQKVLIHGGAGAVGAFAIQFAKQAGATVYTTASADDMDYLKSLDADHIINYKSTDFTSVVKDMDLVLVLTGGDTQARSYQVLKKGGRLVSTTGAILEEEAKKRNVTGISMVVQSDAKQLEKITELIEAGKVITDVAITYPLDEVAKAWETYDHKTADASKFHHGKIVLTMEPMYMQCK